MGGLVGLPLGLRGLKRVTGATRGTRLLALLVAHLCRLLGRLASSSGRGRPAPFRRRALGPWASPAIGWHGLRQPGRQGGSLHRRTGAVQPTATAATGTATVATAATAGAATPDRHRP